MKSLILMRMRLQMLQLIKLGMIMMISLILDQVKQKLIFYKMENIMRLLLLHQKRIGVKHLNYLNGTMVYYINMMLLNTQQLNMMLNILRMVISLKLLIIMNLVQVEGLKLKKNHLKLELFMMNMVSINICMLY